MGEAGEAHRELETALKRLWGFASFRPGQREVVDAVVQGHSVVAIMPTGAGKSLCYQLPAAVGATTTLVVSPLIALMKDQVDSLLDRGIPATFINSHVSPEERHERFRRLRSGEYRLVYVAPERLRHDQTLDWMAQCPVDRMAIDEAHCISQWGHDFRPDYLRLREVAERIGIRQVCAFTATATEEVRQDIVRALGLVQPMVFVHGFRRSNLVLRVVPIQKMRDKVEHIAALHRASAGSGIVYAATRKAVESIATELSARGIRAMAYHAGLDEELRSAAQDRFMSGGIDVIVATNAFGMGVDKPDTRYVVHHDVPGSLEAYYQEAGRAGRDGKLAECAILFSYANVRTQEFFIERIGEDGEDRDRPLAPEEVERLKALERAKLRRIVRYCYTGDCRHETLLRYFGEAFTPSRLCETCDNCLAAANIAPPAWIRTIGSLAKQTSATTSPSSAPPRVRPEAQDTPAASQPPPRRLTPAETLAIRKILSGIARGRGHLTSAQLTSLLRGVQNSTPEALLDTPTFGALSQLSASEILEMVRALEQAGAVSWHGSPPSRLRMDALGVSLMKGECDLELSLAPLKANEDDPAVDPQLFDALRAVRRKQAEDQGVPPFVVAHDAVLKRIAALRPTTLEQLRLVKGVGPNKAATYGPAWLAEVAQSNRPSRR